MGTDRATTASGRPFTIGVISALPEEIAALLKRARLVERVDGQRFYESRLAGRAAILTAGGDGLRKAARGIRVLLERFEVDCVLGLGIAGGLTSGLAAGDLLAGEEVRGPEGPPATADGSLLECARRCSTPVHFGTLLSVPDLITAAGEKQTMGHAIAGAGAVDLESAAWMRAAAAAGKPSLVVRAIFDDAEESLPGYLSAASGGEEGVNRGRLLRHAIAHPSTWRSLVRMWRRMTQSAERLASFAGSFAGSLDLPGDDEPGGAGGL